MIGLKQSVGLNKMEEMISFSDFNRNLETEHRKLFKKYEKVSYKLINTTFAIKFNNKRFFL